MKSFEDIEALAIEKKGGAAQLSALMAEHNGPKTPEELETIGDDRWLLCPDALAHGIGEAPGRGLVAGFGAQVGFAGLWFAFVVFLPFAVDDFAQDGGGAVGCSVGHRAYGSSSCQSRRGGGAFQNTPVNTSL